MEQHVNHTRTRTIDTPNPNTNHTALYGDSYCLFSFIPLIAFVPGSTLGDGVHGDRCYVSTVLIPSSGGVDFLMIGGSTTVYDDAATNDVWRFAGGTNTWTRVQATAAWSRRLEPGLAYIGNTLYLVGGQLPDSSFSGEVWSSLNDGVTWLSIASTSSFTSWGFGSMISVGSSLVLLPGVQANTDDDTNDVWQSTDFGVTWNTVLDEAFQNARTRYFCTLHGADVMLLGGIHSATYSNEIRSMRVFSVTSMMLIAAFGRGTIDLNPPFRPGVLHHYNATVTDDQRLFVAHVEFGWNSGSFSLNGVHGEFAAGAGRRASPVLALQPGANQLVIYTLDGSFHIAIYMPVLARNFASLSLNLSVSGELYSGDSIRVEAPLVQLWTNGTITRDEPVPLLAASNANAMVGSRWSASWIAYSPVESILSTAAVQVHPSRAMETTTRVDFAGVIGVAGRLRSDPVLSFTGRSPANAAGLAAHYLDLTKPQDTGSQTATPIDLNTNTNQVVTGFAISAWVLLDSSFANSASGIPMPIFSCGPAAGSVVGTIHLSILRDYLLSFGSTSSDSIQTNLFGNALPANRWTHIGVSVDPATALVHLWQDGFLVNSMQSTDLTTKQHRPTCFLGRSAMPNSYVRLTGFTATPKVYSLTSLSFTSHSLCFRINLERRPDGGFGIIAVGDPSNKIQLFYDSTNDFRVAVYWAGYGIYLSSTVDANAANDIGQWVDYCWVLNQGVNGKLYRNGIEAMNINSNSYSGPMQMMLAGDVGGTMAIDDIRFVRHAHTHTHETRHSKR